MSSKLQVNENKDENNVESAANINVDKEETEEVNSMEKVISVVNEYIQSEDPADLIKNLLGVGAQLGHPTRAWNPAMSKFIAGHKNKRHIIDLRETVKHLFGALDVIYNAARNNQKILFVCTADQMHEIISEEANRCLQHYIVNRWLGGTLTNWNTVKKSLKKLKSLEEILESPDVENLKKKEVISIQRNIRKLKDVLGGIETLNSKPTVVIVSSSVRESIALKEVKSLKKLGETVVSIGLADTNSNPNMLDYPIPANDDSIRVVEFFFKLFSNTVIKGLLDGGIINEDDVEFSSATQEEVKTDEE